MAKNLDKNRNEQLSLFFISSLTLILLLLISYNFSPLLTGPEEWNWKYFPIKTYSKLWFPFSVFLIYLSFVYYLFSVYRKKLSLKKELLTLTILVLLSFLFLMSIAFLYEKGIVFLSFRITEESSTSFFNVAVNFNNKINYLLSNYSELMPQFPIHAQTHPPGSVFFFWSINKLFEKSSFLTKFVFENVCIGNPLLLKFSKAHGSGAVFSSILIPLLNCLTLIPLYFLGKEIYNQQVAILSASFYSFIPSISLMSPFLDTIYPLLFCTVIYFFLTGLKHGKLFRCFISGIFFALTLFFTFKAIMLLLLLIIILGTILFKEKILNSDWIKKLIVYGRAKYLFSLLILLQFTVWYFFGVKKLTASLIVLLIFLLSFNQEKKKLSNDNSVFPKTNYFSSFTFTVKYLLVFPIASIILFLSLYFIYKFDILNIYHVSKMLRDQATLRNRTYHVWLFFNLYDFFLFLGIPVFVVIFKSLFTELKDLKHIDFFLASFLFTVFILNLSGRVLGETSRLWLPLIPFALYPFSKELLDKNWNRFAQIAVFFILLLLQIITFREFIQVP